MMAGSTCSNQRPDTLMQDRIARDRRNLLHRTAGPYIGSKCDYAENIAMSALTGSGHVPAGSRPSRASNRPSAAPQKHFAVRPSRRASKRTGDKDTCVALRAMSQISNASFSADTSAQSYCRSALGSRSRRPHLRHRRSPGNALREASVRRQPSLRPRPLRHAP